VQLREHERKVNALERRAAAAQAEVKSLQEELKRRADELPESKAHAIKLVDDLRQMQEASARQRAEAEAEMSRARAEAASKIEGLEGTLAECRGKLAGLGEGCGRCWQMLDESQVSSLGRCL
jgi:chromosome segregation ATPase